MNFLSITSKYIISECGSKNYEFFRGLLETIPSRVLERSFSEIYDYEAGISENPNMEKKLFEN